MSFHCILCKNKIEESKTCCDIEYTKNEKYFKYTYDKLLFKNFKEDYLINKVLNNNGFLGYMWLPEGSLALDDRMGVKEFQHYLDSQIKPNAVLLDAGCGTLERPGYLKGPNAKQCTIFGLDPIDSEKYEGIRVTGCMEYTPFPDQYFDVIVFCTSLDHVCSLPHTLKETRRLLKDDGKVVLWVGNNEIPFKQKVKNFLGSIKRRVMNGYNPKRFRIYENGVVLYIPHRCFDPFHSYRESPEKTIKIFKKAKFALTKSFKGDNADINFLTFVKD